MSWRTRLVGVLRGWSEASVSPGFDDDGLDLDGAQVRDVLGRGHRLVWIDLRDAADVAAVGALDGAPSLGVGSSPAEVEAVGDDAHLVFVAGRESTAREAAERLRAAGHDRSWWLSGGASAWHRTRSELDEG